MRITGLGRLLFAAGFAATGVLTIVTRDVAFLWRPLAQGDAWHDTLAVLSGALVLAAAIGLLIPRIEQMASLALAGFLLLRELVLQAASNGRFVQVDDVARLIGWQRLALQPAGPEGAVS